MKNTLLLFLFLATFPALAQIPVNVTVLGAGQASGGGSATNVYIAPGAGMLVQTNSPGYWTLSADTAYLGTLFAPFGSSGSPTTNASQLTVGTLPDARLSTNVVTFSGGLGSLPSSTATNGPDGNPLATYTQTYVVTTNLLPWMTGSGWGDTNVNTLYYLTNNSWVSTNGVILIYANLGDGAFEVSNVLTQDFLYYNPNLSSTNVTDATFFLFTVATWQANDGAAPIGLFTQSATYTTNVVKQFNGNATTASSAMMAFIGPDGFPLLTSLNQTVSNQVFSVTFLGGPGGLAAGSNALWLMAGPSPTALQVASNAPVFLNPNGGALRDPCVIKYGSKFLLYYSVFSSNAPMTIGVAESKNRIQWQFDGYIVPTTNYDGSTNHNFSSNTSGFDNVFPFVDATNGLHINVNVYYGSGVGSSNYTILGDVNPANPTNITNIREIFFNGSTGGFPQNGPIYYAGGYYYLFTGEGAEFVNTSLATNGWHQINSGLSGEAPALINWNGLYWLVTTWGWGQAETSPDLTNWTSIASETSLVGWGNGNCLWSDTPIYNGAFQGDGSGLTNLPAAQLTGTVLTNNLPGALPQLSTGNGERVDECHCKSTHFWDN